MFRKIVVPLDGSSFGEQALPHACAIADRSQAVLRLVHVHTPSATPIYIEGEPVIDAEGNPLYHQHEQLYLEQVKTRLLAQLPALVIEAEAYDRPLESILHESGGEFLARVIAAREDVDLIVMTTHGRGGLSRLWLGSVADVLIRMSRVPILLVRPQEGELDFSQLPTYRHLLIPLDGSPLAEQILAPAQTLGDLMDAEYTLLRVVEPLPVTYGLSGQQLLRTKWQSTQTAQEYLNQVAHRLADPHQQIRCRVLTHDHVAVAILEDTGRYNVDLIAMATHGHSGLRRLVNGSVADKVVRGTTLPLLLYRPQEERAE
jgi:nucleotide-binding universal stress UspA family protein